MSTISTVPPLLEIAISETRVWPLDTTPTLQAMGLTGLASPVVTVVNPATGATIAGAAASPQITGNVITVTINGSVLTFLSAYQIRWTAISQGQTITWVTQLNAIAW